MSVPEPRSVALVGAGRAGRAVVGALVATGWRVVGVAGRSPDSRAVRAAAADWAVPARVVGEVARGAALVVLAVPDAAIEAVAVAVASATAPDTLVIHLAGARGVDALDALACRTGALHPLQTLPDGARGQAALAGSWAAVAGDEEVAEIAASIGLRPFIVPDDARAAYHAAACIASNHLVALFAQVEATTDVPLDAFLALARATLDNIGALGPGAALTGPVRRGDAATVASHLVALPATEREAYRALARRAAMLAGRSPDLDGVLA